MNRTRNKMDSRLPPTLDYVAIGQKNTLIDKTMLYLPFFPEILSDTASSIKNKAKRQSSLK